jgi:CBS domain-containing protein
VRIRDILSGKGFDVVVIKPESSVDELLRLLRDHNLGSVVVSRDGRVIDGIVTERDVVRRLADGTDFLERPVAEIMTTHVRTCTFADSVDSLMHTMTNERIRHVPVVDKDGLLIGLVSIGDIVKSHVTDIEFALDQLEGYVRS